MTDDRKLIKQIQSGDKEAFETLVENHYKNIYSYMYRRTLNENIASDLTQDVFLKLIRAVYNYKFSGKFKNLIFTIAVNTCRDYFRKQKNDTEYKTDELLSEEGSPEEELIKKSDNKKLHKRLSLLPEGQRDAILLYYFHDMKAKDVAAVTGVGVSTAKSRIKQGLLKLKKMYEGDMKLEKK